MDGWMDGLHYTYPDGKGRKVAKRALVSSFVLFCLYVRCTIKIQYKYIHFQY